MFKIKIGCLYIRDIVFNTYDNESSITFTADFDEGHKFNKDNYFYRNIIQNLLEIDNVELLEEVDSTE